MHIGKLTELELRELWKNEERDFSAWMAKEENIEYLNEILGLTLTDIKREERVGSYECDIVAKDDETGFNIIIENQLENSNHDHLGKLITYASGLNANVIVWIVKKARDEHRSAIEWLNNNTGNNINFFLIEVHAYRIGDSDPAPIFQVIEEPNGFIKNMNHPAGSSSNNKSQSERLIFWNQFNDLLADKNYPINKRKATNRAWYDVTIGSSKTHIAMELINKDGYIRLGLYMQDDKDWFDKLYSNKEQIEQELGFELEWQRECKSTVSRICYNLYGLNFDNKDNYDVLMNQMIVIVVKMREVFKKYM